MCILNKEGNGTEHPIKLTPRVKKESEELLEIELLFVLLQLLFSVALFEHLEK